jgi:nuclear pore complex protein Nup98-Nup96
MSRPKNWPETVGYLSAPSHCRSLSSTQVEALRTKPPAESMERLPASATQTPCPLVRIQIIEDEQHPARGQRGLFAARDLKPGSFVVAYLGRVHDGGPRGTDAESDYDLWLDRDKGLAVDAARAGNEARFVNDYRGVRPRPNAQFGTAWSERWGQLCVGFWVMPAAASSSKKGGKGKKAEGIRKGDEILVSYGKGFWEKRQAQEEGEDGDAARSQEQHGC